MQDYVTKPIGPDILFAALLKWIRHRDGLGEMPERQSVSSDEMVQIPEIPGLNTVSALKRMNGKRNLYLDVLKRFYNENTTACADIRKAYEDKELATAQRLTHTLKGLCGSIGADQLQECTARLEKTIIENDPAGFEQEMRQLEPLMRDLVAHMDNLLIPAKEITAITADIPRAEEIIEKLRKMLEAKSPKAKTLLPDLRKSSISGAELSELEGNIARYDYKSALASLAKIDEKLKKQ